MKSPVLVISFLACVVTVMGLVLWWGATVADKRTAAIKALAWKLGGGWIFPEPQPTEVAWHLYDGPDVCQERTVSNVLTKQTPRGSILFFDTNFVWRHRRQFGQPGDTGSNRNAMSASFIDVHGTGDKGPQILSLLQQHGVTDLVPQEVGLGISVKVSAENFYFRDEHLIVIWFGEMPDAKAGDLLRGIDQILSA
jgi:hypothetical protein